VSSRPHPLISYAQNGEDIILARALRPWERKGFWVDCGAGHPKYDSVTKLFSECGWTGINIEPLDQEFMLLNQDRPHDENIQCLLGGQEGMGIIYAGPPENRGSSTSDPSLVARYKNEFGQTFEEKKVTVRRLNDILREKIRPDIDFLKIDVEGSEELVLQGIDFNEFRPKVLVIEATEPNSTEAAYHHWEARVLNSGYLFAFFDGLNRYYVDQKYKDLISDIAIPANILDNYKTNIQIEIEKELESYMNQFNNSITYTNSLLTENEKTTQYVNSLVQEIEKCQLAIADQQQHIIDVEDRISILKASNRAMEDKIVELSSATNKLKRILSTVAIRILRKLKRILRKLLGR